MLAFFGSRLLHWNWSIFDIALDGKPTICRLQLLMGLSQLHRCFPSTLLIPFIAASGTDPFAISHWRKLSHSKNPGEDICCITLTEEAAGTYASRLCIAVIWIAART